MNECIPCFCFTFLKVSLRITPHKKRRNSARSSGYHLQEDEHVCQSVTLELGFQEVSASTCNSHHNVMWNCNRRWYRVFGCQIQSFTKRGMHTQKHFARYIVQCRTNPSLRYKMPDVTALPRNLFNLTVRFKPRLHLK